MTEVEVDGSQLGLRLVVTDVPVAVALHIDVDVVTVERVGQLRTGEAARVGRDLTTGHHALAQSEGELRIHRYGGLQGDVES